MVRESIVFPSVEGLLLAWLRDQLAVPVVTAVPSPRPPAFVRVRRTGGPTTSIVVDSAQMTIEAWAESVGAADDLARLARAHVNALRGRSVNGTQVYRVVEFSGPANLPDPTSGQARYTWTVQVNVRGAPL